MDKLYALLRIRDVVAHLLEALEDVRQHNPEIVTQLRISLCPHFGLYGEGKLLTPEHGGDFGFEALR
jgi:hypothetical protein